MLIYLQMIETEEERSKFEEIYLEYRDLLFWLADRRLHSAEDAEDAVHNVFVKAAEHIRRIEPAGPRTKRLLVVMLENAVTDMLRKRGREPAEAGWELEPSAVDPDMGERNCWKPASWRFRKSSARSSGSSTISATACGRSRGSWG